MQDVITERVVSRKPLRQRWAGGIVPAVAGFVLLQCAYWLWLYPSLVVPMGKLPRIAVTDVRAATVNSAHIKDWHVLPMREVSLPWEDCCDPGYRALSMTFHLDAVPEEGLAIVPIVGSDNYRLWVNGSLLIDDGRFELPDITYHGNVRAVFRMPSAALHEGQNTLRWLLVRDGGSPNFLLMPPLIGDYALFKSAFRVRTFVLNDYNTISYTMGLSVALLALVLYLRAGYPPVLGWLALLSASWSLRLLYYEMTDPPLRDAGRMSMLYAMVNLLPVAWLNLANCWGGRPWPWLGRISLSAFLLLQVMVTAILFLRWFDHIDTVDSISMWFGLLLASVTLVRFGCDLRDIAAERAAEYAVFGFCMFLLGLTAINSLRGGGADHVNLVMPLLLLGLVAAFLARNIRLFRSTEQINRLLAERLKERESELSAAHERERHLVHRQARIEERQQVLRDMHDGLGSQLMSMLLAARRGRCEPVSMAEGLQAVVDDMRMMMDSMEAVSDSLPAALTTLRERIGVRLREAGFTLRWQQEGDLSLPGYGPHDILHILRILQEAISNALKHSKGDTIEVGVLGRNDARAQVELSVKDNGCGWTEARTMGRGVANLRGRAEQLGADLSMSSTSNGVCVRLCLSDRASKDA